MLETAERDPKKLIQLLAEFAYADVPLTAPFVEEFYARLQSQGPAMAFVQTWVEQKLLEQGVTAAQLSETAGRTAATNQISIANSIGFAITLAAIHLATALHKDALIGKGCGLTRLIGHLQHATVAQGFYAVSSRANGRAVAR